MINFNIFEEDSSQTFETKQIHLNNLKRMVGYCENMTDCRRAQQLEYFAEVSALNILLLLEMVKIVILGCLWAVRNAIGNIFSKCFRITLEVFFFFYL